MFTGIVEYVGRLARVEQRPDLLQLGIDLGPVAEGVAVGDSVAVAGCCLTVTGGEGGVFTFDVIEETLGKTRFAELVAGDRVNLERAMGADKRFDGHVVQGHVDGVGRVRRSSRSGNEVELHLECEPVIADQLVDKGSVTIDGVSLTVVRVVEDGFHVALIPHTLAVTTLSDLSEGDAVHLEVDVFGKYIRQYVERVLPPLLRKQTLESAPDHDTEHDEEE